MEIFETDIVKKEFEKVQKEDLIEIFKCGYCQKRVFESFHKNVLASCKLCRENFYRSCQSFNITKENLLSYTDEIGKEYIENFIKDFINLSDRTIESTYKLNIIRKPIQKKFLVKSYIKSSKNRSQVINQKVDGCEKIHYTLKGKKKNIL